ncbi:hypothetical protein BH10BAC1_BH10BAC1_07790 [soil metagenome]
MRKSILVLLLAIPFVFSSCRKEMEKPSWDTELLAPLIDASMSINNILPDSILLANPDSSMKIVFNNDLYKIDIDTLFQIADTTIHNSYALPSALPLPAGYAIPFPSTTSTTYSLPGIELKTVIIKSGFVSFKVKSKIQEATVYTYGIPCATLAGVPFSRTFTVPARVGSTPGVYNLLVDLSGYTINLTGPAGTQINTIYTSLTAFIDPMGSAVTVNPSDSLIIDNTFSDIIPYYAKGYFGNNTYNVGPSTSAFTLFDRIVGGTINLEDVDFNFKIENPIGMDARLYVNNISSINTRTGTTINLVNPLIGPPININRAAESGGTIYPTYANFPLNTTNSNIKPMIENLPNKFGYSMQVITNPLGNISGSNDFIYSDRLLKASLDMEIPLSLVANNLTLADTLALNISPTSGTQNIHDGTITLFANNGFPFDATLQMYLLNESNVVMDSIFGYANTIVEAPINSSLRVIGKKLTKITVPITESKMDLLYSTKKVVLKVKFNTSAQPQYIKIYSEYAIDVKLVGDFNYTIQLH